MLNELHQWEGIVGPAFSMIALFWLAEFLFPALYPLRVAYGS